MTPRQLQALAERRTSELATSLSHDLRQLREDAGISQRALARFTGIDQAEISRIEAGRSIPTLGTCSRLATGLGTNLSLRLFPNTGPPVRDRHQAPVVEALVAGLHQRWRAYPEVGVRSPVRGWIDVVLADMAGGDLPATEIVSSIHRLEQLLRWSAAKADALPSAVQWPFGMTDPSISRVLVLRSTRANRTLVEAFKATMAAAYPGDPWQALAALTGLAAWPGPTLLWSMERAGRVEIVAEPTGARGSRRLGP